MKIRQIRNATILLTLGEHRLLVDPMLSDAHTLPGLKLIGGGRQNIPLVEMPDETWSWLREVTGVLITHEHPDHLDAPATEWILERELPVWASSVDVPHLRQKGLDARVLTDGALGMNVEAVPARHGRGLLGWVLGPAGGFYLAHPEEPSVYLTGDAVLTRNIVEAIERLQPDVIVAPAGSASIGIGGKILFSMDELVELARIAKGAVLFNHLEALDHCPTTRKGLVARMTAEGLLDKVLVPDDGELVDFTAHIGETHRAQLRRGPLPAPGFQKWLTAQVFDRL